MEPRILARDRRTGKLVLFHELANGSFVVETQYDVEDVIRSAQYLKSEETGNWQGDLYLVAQIPMPLHQQLQSAGITKDQAAFKKFLNNPDFAKFRTKTGRL
jgi:hypothetical protein